MVPHKINTRRRWWWPLIFGCAVVLLVGTGLVLIARHDVRAIAAPVGSVGAAATDCLFSYIRNRPTVERLG